MSTQTSPLSCSIEVCILTNSCKHFTVWKAWEIVSGRMQTPESQSLFAGGQACCRSLLLAGRNLLTEVHKRERSWLWTLKWFLVPPLMQWLQGAHPCSRNTESRKMSVTNSLYSCRESVWFPGEECGLCQAALTHILWIITTKPQLTHLRKGVIIYYPLMATHTTLAMIISNNTARTVVFKTSSESPAVSVPRSDQCRMLFICNNNSESLRLLEGEEL